MKAPRQAMAMMMSNRQRNAPTAIGTIISRCDIQSSKHNCSNNTSTQLDQLHDNFISGLFITQITKLKNNNNTQDAAMTKNRVLHTPLTLGIVCLKISQIYPGIFNSDRGALLINTGMALIPKFEFLAAPAVEVLITPEGPMKEVLSIGCEGCIICNDKNQLFYRLTCITIMTIQQFIRLLHTQYIKHNYSQGVSKAPHTLNTNKINGYGVQ